MNCRKLFDRDLHIKTTGNAALLSPPFISSKENLDFMVQILRDMLTHRQS